MCNAACGTWVWLSLSCRQRSIWIYAGFFNPVRRTQVPLGLLGGLGKLSTSSSADSDILYEYIQSQKLVENIDKNINLRALYSKAKEDPVFSFDTNGSIEDLLDYWGRMVDISYDSGTQLTNIIVKAFAPEDAQLIAQEIQKESTSLINQLNLIARKDTTRYAKQELDISAQKLKEARGELTLFRTTTQIIDPSANLQGQMGLLNQLEGQLAEALISGDLLIETTSSSDPRLLHADRKIEVIRNRIDAERGRLAGVNGQGEGTLSTLVGDFERLSVEQKFAEETYLLALSTHNTAALEAQRQSLYLAAHIEPTLAETSQYPERGLLGSLFIIWLGNHNIDLLLFKRSALIDDHIAERFQKLSHERRTKVDFKSR